MPLRHIAGTDLEYFLVVYDEDGNERAEPDGKLLSELVSQRVAAASAPVSDVFFTSHGWKGDVPAAIEQYDRWIAAMGAVDSDRSTVIERRPGFRPLIVGLHWPSLPWGDESIGTEGGAVLSARGDIEQQVDAFARRIADTPAARDAIRTIVKAARDQPGSTKLSPATSNAYATLFAESGLGTGDAGGRPGSDQEAFDPEAIIEDFASTENAASGATQLLGFTDKIKDAILMPLRQLSFWKIKDRARLFGETGAHELLRRLQAAAPSAKFHLMGHSFGCIVVSATVAGAANTRPLPRPVDSLFLVQGALSLWAYAKDIPYARGTAGYFNRILELGLVRGPIVTTRSRFDTAVGRFYPLGARIKQQLVLGDDKYPEYGGIGTFGIQGVAGAEDAKMQSAQFAYSFRQGGIYNLEASSFIKTREGASGAHSDIAHPEVAHAFWAAVLASDASAPPDSGFLGGGEVSPTIAPRRTQAEDDWFATPKVMRHTPPLETGSVRGGGLLGIEPGAAPTPAMPVSSSTASPPPSPPPAMSAPSSMPSPADTTPLGPPPSPARAAQRWVNAEIENQPPTEPLATGRWYTLVFDVDVERRTSAVMSTEFDDKHAFSEGETEVTLTVQIDTTDFDISDQTRPMRLARTGRALTKARFDIFPRKNGPSTIKATIHKEGNFIQQIELTFDVGADKATAVEATSRGRSAAAANVIHPRDIGLSISPSAEGYDCVVWGAVSARARLPIQPAEVASAIDAARNELMKVVMYQNAKGEYTFQRAIDIPEADRAFALNTMARAGARLFQRLFFGPGAAADSKTIGDFLRRMASDRSARLKLQVVAERTPVPWSLLYVGDAAAGAALDWDNFIGMSHIVEQIPLQNTLSVSDCAIRSDKPTLSVSVNVNSSIDAQMGVDFVAQQNSFWKKAAESRKRVRVTDRTKSSELVKALADATTDDQILYFYCHAQAAGLTDPGGPDASCLVLTDAQVTLGELALDSPTTTQLPGNPLVFINACESAEMSPTFYDGFVPYFMAKGARGVVGTECKTPALFASDWAKRFFERFLEGEPLGEAFLGLRREFLQKHGNPLGLLYAVHCDGDTQIQPALP